MCEIIHTISNLSGKLQTCSKSVLMDESNLLLFLHCLAKTCYFQRQHIRTHYHYLSISCVSIRALCAQS